jgi:two-component system response regulator YesN
LVTLGTGPSANSGGIVEYVERLLGSRWGFFVRFGGQSASVEIERQASRGRADVIVPEPPGMLKEAFDYYERLGRLRRYVMDHYDEDLNLERAADIAALEKTYFSTYFRSKVGVNYRDWIQNLRVRKAMARMRQRHESITDVAFSVGFGDLRTFQRAFRKWTGMTPRQYKKLVS